jgi:WD40 repeat protein
VEPGVKLDPAFNGTSPVTSLDYASVIPPDGGPPLLAAGSYNGGGFIWSGGTVVGQWRQSRLINSVRFGWTSSAQVVTVSADLSVEIYDIVAGRTVLRLGGETIFADDPTDVAINPRTGCLAVAAEDSAVHLLTPEGVENGIGPRHDFGGVMAVDYSSEGYLVSCGDDQTLRICPPDGERTAVARLSTDTEIVWFAPEGHFAAAGLDDGRIVFVDLEGDVVEIFPTSVGPVKGLAFEPDDGTRLAVGGYFQAVELFDVADRPRPIRRLHHPQMWPRAMSWGVHGTLAVGTFAANPLLIGPEDLG